MSVNNVLSESLSLQNRMLLEASSSGGEYLPQVIEAMRKNVRVKVCYQRYGTEEPKQLDFEPYCIKLFNRETPPHKKVCFSASRASHSCKLQSVSAVGVTQSVTQGVTHFCASHLFCSLNAWVKRSIPAVCPCGHSVWRLDGPCAEDSLFQPARRGLRRPFRR